ncbi:MlaD family protein [Gemmatimonas sp.]|uniref:MlaD family protein n=1 Tax=Gemmatimonas sp. TaxID=1962908 RepID=UPI003566B2CA
MSIRANPTAIGLFLIGALAIVIVGVAVLASATWFQSRTTFISFFPESVNGLENGAPVKFQGVPVGRVTAINIQIDPRDDSFQVPVEYEIDLPRLTTSHGTFVNLEDTLVLKQQIKKGLRAQLQMESFVTGVLYLELAYRLDSAPPRLYATDSTLYPQIATSPSLMAAIGGGAGSLLSEMLKILNRVNGMLGDVNMREINTAVVQSSKAVQQLMESPELRATLREMPGATAQFNRTLAEAERLTLRAGVALDSIQPGVKGASTEAVATLQELRKTLEEAHSLMSADTGPGYALTGALTSMREAADALRVLINSLEQNPDMLMRGKKPPAKR